ncbi:unnamed protein product [Amoebophrya sp. A25]|nr:unnamed protein product [Amoebophrya sp. A25]|eukprot:GSA25T00009393001.1
MSIMLSSVGPQLPPSANNGPHDRRRSEVSDAFLQIDEDDASDSTSSSSSDHGMRPLEPWLPWLFIGGKDEAKDLNLLRKHNVKYVINCTPPKTEGGLLNFHEKSHAGAISYLRLRMQDNASEKLERWLPPAFEFLNQCRIRQDGACLVHCKEGISRSVSVVIAYMLAHFWSCPRFSGAGNGEVGDITRNGTANTANSTTPTTIDPSPSLGHTTLTTINPSPSLGHTTLNPPSSSSAAEVVQTCLREIRDISGCRREANPNSSFIQQLEKLSSHLAHLKGDDVYKEEKSRIDEYLMLAQKKKRGRSRRDCSVEKDDVDEQEKRDEGSLKASKKRRGSSGGVVGPVMEPSIGPRVGPSIGPAGPPIGPVVGPTVGPSIGPAGPPIGPAGPPIGPTVGPQVGSRPGSPLMKNGLISAGPCIDPQIGPALPPQNSRSSK